MKLVRSFEQEVMKPLKNIESQLKVNSIGEVSYDTGSYPILRVQNFSETNDLKPTILLTGGVHGDEPAGVFALISFFQNTEINALDKFQIVVYPCINPSGFERNILETQDGVNLNRSFGISQAPPEVVHVQEDLAKLNLKFDFVMDMHECQPNYVGEGFTEKDNPHSCWLYESQRDVNLRMGRQMIDSLPEHIEVCNWDEIYHDENDRGVVNFLPETTKNKVYAMRTTLDSYVLERFTEHSFTTETPTGWNLNDRIATHLSFLKTAMDLTEVRVKTS